MPEDETVGELECMTCGGFLVWIDVDDEYRCYSCGKTVHRPPPSDRGEIVTDGGEELASEIDQCVDGTERCDHPLSSIERRGEPDWKNGSQTIWYYGFCMNCGASVEVEYEFDGTTEVDHAE